jgi:protein SCO1/2
MNKKNFWLATGILVIPVVFFYIFNAGTQNFERLPIFGERTAPDGINSKDTIYYAVADFHLTDQNGKAFSQENLSDGIYLCNFFFASCKEVCPKMNRRLQSVYDKYKEFSEVHFVSVTVDPTNDNPGVLKEYAKQYNADAKIWHFLTGNNDSIVQLGKNLLLPISQESKTIDHSQQFILVDKSNRIRGVYDSESDAEIQRLEGDIKLLLYEYHAPGTSR